MKKNWSDTANKALSYFKSKKRDDKSEFWSAGDNAPQWVKDLCYTAHKVDDVMPNDYIYAYIVEALDLIVEASGAECLSEIEEDIFGIEGEVYNSDLLSWVSSNLSFSSYVDQAMSEFEAKEHFNALMIGNSLHKQAIAMSVLSSIDDQAEDVEDE